MDYIILKAIFALGNIIHEIGVRISFESNLTWKISKLIIEYIQTTLKTNQFPGLTRPVNDVVTTLCGSLCHSFHLGNSENSAGKSLINDFRCYCFHLL